VNGKALLEMSLDGSYKTAVVSKDATGKETTAEGDTTTIEPGHYKLNVSVDLVSVRGDTNQGTPDKVHVS
jgi:hypothetical protein